MQPLPQLGKEVFTGKPAAFMHKGVSKTLQMSWKSGFAQVRQRRMLRKPPPYASTNAASSSLPTHLKVAPIFFSFQIVVAWLRRCAAGTKVSQVLLARYDSKGTHLLKGAPNPVELQGSVPGIPAKKLTNLRCKGHSHR